MKNDDGDDDDYAYYINVMSLTVFQGISRHSGAFGKDCFNTVFPSRTVNNCLSKSA